MIISGENLIEVDGKWLVEYYTVDVDTGKVIDRSTKPISEHEADKIINEYLEEEKNGI